MIRIAIGLSVLLLIGSVSNPTAAEPVGARAPSGFAFGVPDVLDIHALDYSHLGLIQEAVRTSYRPGEGYPDDAEVAPERLAASQGPALDRRTIGAPQSR